MGEVGLAGEEDVEVGLAGDELVVDLTTVEVGLAVDEVDVATFPCFVLITVAGFDTELGVDTGAEEAGMGLTTGGED